MRDALHVGAEQGDNEADLLEKRLSFVAGSEGCIGEDHDVAEAVSVVPEELDETLESDHRLPTSGKSHKC